VVADTLASPNDAYLGTWWELAYDSASNLVWFILQSPPSLLSSTNFTLNVQLSFLATYATPNNRPMIPCINTSTHAVTNSSLA
jgi:hypothetical protein